jgi:ribonuclease HI
LTLHCAPRRKMTANIYVDGACTGNGRPGAESSFGVWVEGEPSLCISRKITGFRNTNQVAELLALREALIMSENYKEVTIYTDSMYSIMSITDWAAMQEPRGWTNSRGKEISNKDIIVEMVEIKRRVEQTGTKLNIVHVRGHQNNYGNESAHNLAHAALNN